MKTFKPHIAALIVSMACSTGAFAQTMSKAEYKLAKDAISATYKSVVGACVSLSGNSKDICRADASGRESVAIAELKEKQNPSVKTTYKVKVAQANATYSVARQKCDDMTGNAKDVCVKEAKAASISAKADAKAEMKAASANSNAAQSSANAYNKATTQATEARKDAAVDKRAADYAVAREKCDVFAAEAKETCLKEAKTRFGQS